MGNPEKLATRRGRTQHNMCWNHYTQANRNNVYKTWVLLETTGDKDEPNNVFLRKS